MPLFWQKASGSGQEGAQLDIKHNPIKRFSTSPCPPLQIPTNTKLSDTYGYQQFLAAEFKSKLKIQLIVLCATSII